jgi:uncharacterized membrane protein
MEVAMSDRCRVLLAGESWVSTTTHVKGFDSFTTSTYAEGADDLRAALTDGGFDVHFLPNHLAPTQFPSTAEALREYRCVLLSDIGTNTLLLAPATWERGETTPNRLELLKEYVLAGGGLIMVGGYLTFQGIEGKGKWAGSPVEEVLPVTLRTGDDRVERPEGIAPRVVADHPILAGLEATWPAVLGYNRVTARPDAQVLAQVGDDVLLACREIGRGRTVAYTTDCGPHWCPPPFVAWSGYARVWQQMVGWAAGLE